MQNKTFQACLIVALYNWTLLKKQEKRYFFIFQIYIYEFTDYAMSIRWVSFGTVLTTTNPI